MTKELNELYTYVGKGVGDPYPKPEEIDEYKTSFIKVISLKKY